MEAGKEEPLVASSLHERVCGVSVRLDFGEADLPSRVFLLPDVAHDLRSSLLRHLHDRIEILYGKGDVLDAVSVRDQMGAHFLVPRVEGGRKREHDLILSNDVAAHFPRACLQALVGEGLEAHPRAVVAGGLLGISDPEG